ncbi:MAG: hypothetical protein C0403_08415 [Desulfobacterium sp.]|nr:hypothetical protein [Desulfobacterium sp.]
MKNAFLIITLVFYFIFQENLVAGDNKTSPETFSELKKDKVDSSTNLWIGTFNVPTGSIIAWVPNYENSQIELDKEKNLPKNFLVCDGPHKIDNPETKFNERKIPKLIADNVFQGVKNSSIIFIIKVD